MFTPPSSLRRHIVFWVGSLFLMTMPSDCIVSASSSATIGVELPRHHDHATPTMEDSSINIYHQDAYALIATAVSKRLFPTSTFTPSSDQLSKIRNALKSLSNAQGTLKTIDGISHEAYQRTHRSSSKSTSDKTFDSETDGKVSGRATRSANRVGCAADAFLACELCDYLSSNCDNKGGTLVHRQVLLNDTMACPTNNKDDGSNTMKLKVMVLYEHEYNGGNGLNHGGIDNLLLQQQQQSSSQQNSSGGRILVIISNTPTPNLPSSMEYLDEHPLSLTLSSGLVGNEVASVHGGLWRSAGKLLELIAPVLNRYAHGDNEDDRRSNVAIHFVGHSLAGGVAGLAAAILDGALPMPNGSKSRRGGRRKKRGGKVGKRSKANISEEKHEATPTSEQQSLSNATTSTSTNTNTTISIEGFGQGRSSAVALGPPPCLSPNVRVEFVTSIIYGDDVICRTTKESFDRLCRRTENTMNKGILGKKMGWMGDAVSLTVSSLKSHAAGSEGEETRLSIPGKTYLIRPRRLDNICSMHEILTSGGSGREAMRASVLWQLDNVLLSKSLWIHHDLGSYIRGLDRVQLRSFSSDDDDEEEE